MANPEHLAILKQGVEVWNKWREENPGERPDLQGADLGGADLGGADLQRAFLWRADFRAAFLRGAKLQNADMRDTDLQSTDLLGAKLQGANLWGADLQGADMRHADLQCVKLWEANLTRLNLTRAKNIEGIQLYRAIMDGMQLPKEKLGRALSEEITERWEAAQDVYLSLKVLWEQQGRYNDAAWAYGRERRMEKKAALERARAAKRNKKWGETTKNYTKVVLDQLQELICDYGENVWLVLLSILAMCIGFALIYKIFSLVLGPWQQTILSDGTIVRTRVTTKNVWQLLAYSLGTMTGTEPVGLEAYPCLAMQILAPVQSFLGIGLAGLMGFVLGNRIRRS